MASKWSNTDALGLQPVYEVEPWRAPWLLRAFAYALVVVAVLIVTTIALDRLGKPARMGMTCWDSGDHNGAIVCTIQTPDGATGDEG